MADAWAINIPTSINIQPNVILQNPVTTSTSLLNDVTLDTSQVTPSKSVYTIIPKVSIDSKSNELKRELRNTACSSFEEECSSNNNFPSNFFSSFPSVPQLNPCPSINVPCLRCDSEDSSNLSNSVECDCLLSNPARCSPLFTNLRPTLNTPVFDSSNIMNSKQTVQCVSGDIQNQPIVENVSPSDMIRLNNNLMKAKALQNNICVSQSSVNNDANCANTVNTNIIPESVLRIRNDVIPKMRSETVAVKSVVQNNDDNRGCPQLGAVSAQNNIPCIQYDNTANNMFKPESNLNIAKMIKDNKNDNNNNNQGCPQLKTIPVYNKESLLKKKALSSSSNNVDCSENVNNNNCVGQVNQNNQGCPQLLTIAQNNLYQKENNDASINGDNNQNCNCETESNLNNNCNCVPTFTPNDNLAQALQIMNLAKARQAQNPSTSINILPFGETLLDGQPICNNFVSLDTLSCPAQLPTISCSGMCNSKKLTLQDLSVPISIAPPNSNSISSLRTSVPCSTNIMLTPRVNSVNNVSPMTNIAPSVPNIAISNSQCPQPFIQPLIFNQDLCNNNIQSLNPMITPNFIPLQSLSQVPFVNNLPSSSISVTPSLSLTDTCISPISNLPSVCIAIQPFAPQYPLLPSNRNQAECLSGASSAISPINRIVNTLTKNVMSQLLSKRLPASPSLAKLPPVNPYSSNLVSIPLFYQFLIYQ
ncbi:probable basic-leucine zipper transcription factor S [Leguminivora glycinivorella]|uniref:probable basic-leucine zipper transcription factor S n=1 Tax=Leguminivora glycinivorella TaxID=1035111 RepID=UPI00200BD6BB|nr:probable basic-leucine zipper transcription factor S [Leguminivora glycinivorella]